MVRPIAALAYDLPASADRETGAPVIVAGIAPVSDTKRPARVTRHQASVRTLYLSRSLFSRCEWAGGRNPGRKASVPTLRLMENERTANHHVRVIDTTGASECIPEGRPVDVAMEELIADQPKRWRRQSWKPTTVPMAGGMV